MPIMRRDADDDPDVQMTPIIDMVFLLLIFFIVTASLKKPVKVLHIDLETATYAKDAKLQDEVIISMTAEGERYLYDGKTYLQSAVDRGELTEYLHTLSLEAPETPIRLDIDRLAPFYRVNDLVNNLELYSLRKVMFRSGSGPIDEGV